MTARSRLAPIAFLGLIVVVAVLLLAGYGVPVGVGLIAGFVLGALSALIGTLWLRAGPGRSISVGPRSISTSLEAAPFDLPDWAREGARVQPVDASPLRGIIVVRQRAEVGGVVIELLTLELRELGGIVAATATIVPPTGPLGPFARASVTDDLGAVYAAAATQTGGGPLVTRLELRFAPAPPPAAAHLELRIDEFIDPFPGHRGTGITGPWSFTIALRGAR